MRIGFRTSPQNTDWASLDAAWAEAGQHDVFDSGWLNDHLTDPNRDRGGPSFETMTTLAALAHHVPGKSVGQTVLAATFRHPGDARQGGGHARPCDGRPVHPRRWGPAGTSASTSRSASTCRRLRERFDRFEATIRVLQRTVQRRGSGHAPGVTLDAPPYRLDGAVMEPGPVADGGPEIWLGGQGPRGLRLAARYADGWNYASNLAGTLDGFIERRDRLRAECEAIGRDPDTLTLSVQIIIPAAGEERRAALERAIAYGRAGASEILLTTPARDGAAGIRRLATEVATPLRDAFG